jgi:hypothetical protein
MRLLVRTMFRLAAQMYCGRCQKWTEIGPGMHCSECGL